MGKKKKCVQIVPQEYHINKEGGAAIARLIMDYYVEHPDIWEECKAYCEKARAEERAQTLMEGGLLCVV